MVEVVRASPVEPTNAVARRIDGITALAAILLPFVAESLVEVVAP
jgi:hypothetical protein